MNKDMNIYKHSYMCPYYGVIRGYIMSQTSWIKIVNK